MSQATYKWVVFSYYTKLPICHPPLMICCQPTAGQVLKGGSAIGALVTVQAGGRTHVDRIVTGDSFTAQHAPVVHFGLGEIEEVESLTVQWSDGRSVTFNNPEADRYHDLSTAPGQ